MFLLNYKYFTCKVSWYLYYYTLRLFCTLILEPSALLPIDINQLRRETIDIGFENLAFLKPNSVC